MSIFSALLINLSLAVLLFAQNNGSIDVQAPKASNELIELNQRIDRLYNDKKYSEALPFAKEAVELTKKEFGKDHLRVAVALRNIAYIYALVFDRENASSSFASSYQIFRKHLPLDQDAERLYVEVMEYVAYYRALDGKFEDAAEKLTNAIEIREKLGGKDSLEIATSLYRLAETFLLRQEYEEAMPFLNRALDIRLYKLGISNSETKILANVTSCTMSKLGMQAELDGFKQKYYPKVVSATERPIQGGVVNGKAIELVVPSYPEEARYKRVSGIVRVTVLINQNGKVVHACALGGPRVLHSASEAAAYRSRFSPTLLSGEPVMVSGVIVYNFQR